MAELLGAKRVFSLGGDKRVAEMSHSLAGEKETACSHMTMTEQARKVHDEIGNKRLRKDPRLDRYYWENGELRTRYELGAAKVREVSGTG